MHSVKFALIACFFLSQSAAAQTLPGFHATNHFDEQEMEWQNQPRDTRIRINAPLRFNKKGKTYLVLYGTPNGNSIEWTAGKIMNDSDDWHYDGQHTAAQIRFVRNTDKKNNYVLAYVATEQKSWPAWRKANAPAAGLMIKHIVDTLCRLFANFHPRVVLNGHSGGGSFTIGYLNEIGKIPPQVERIAFLDSDYGYEDSLHKQQLATWLKSSKNNNLFVIAYNDSNVIFNGKQLVSATGGTWYRSRLMQRGLSAYFPFHTEEDTSFIRHTALGGRITMVFKKNPAGLIYHTIQVQKNGFIYSLLSGTSYDNRKYFRYFEDRAYTPYVIDP